MPRFLERDEAIRREPRERYPVGRRRRCAALSARWRRRSSREFTEVLARIASSAFHHIPVLRGGRVYRQPRRPGDRTIGRRLAEVVGRISMRQRRPGPPGPAAEHARRAGSAAGSPGGGPGRDGTARRASFPRRRLCRWEWRRSPQTPDDYVQSLSATSGLPHCADPGEHEAAAPALFADATIILRGLTPGPRSRGARPGIRRAAGVPVSFSAITDVARGDSAEQLAGGERALDPLDRA